MSFLSISNIKIPISRLFRMIAKFAMTLAFGSVRRRSDLFTRGSNQSNSELENLSEPVVEHSPGRTVATIAADAPPYVQCTSHDSSLRDLTDPELRYYKYWRQQFRRGTILPADSCYRVLYASELAEDAPSYEQLEAAWSELVRVFVEEDPKVARIVAGWIIDIRFELGRFIVDDIVELGATNETRLDIILLAKCRPTWIDIASAVIADLNMIRLVAAHLADREPNLDPIIELTTVFPALNHRVEILRGLKRQDGSNKLLNKVYSERPSFVANDSFYESIASLFEEVCEKMELPYTPSNEERFGSSRASKTPLQIFDPPALVREDPPADTLLGVLSTIHYTLNVDAGILLAAVIASSESKPYIEGRVDFSRELRGKFEKIGTACNQQGRIGQFRHAFFSLSHGTRAMWQVSPAIDSYDELRIGIHTARFVRALQHGLSGVTAKRTVLQALVKTLSERTNTSAEVLVAALVSICGASTFIIPSHEREDAS